MSEGAKAKSPLTPISPLLHFYSWIGTFPAGMDSRCTKFWVSWPRYLITLGAMGLIYGAVWLLKYLADTSSTDDINLDTGYVSKLDQVFMSIRLKVDVASIVLIIVLNHRQIGRYTSLLEYFATIRGAATSENTKDDKSDDAGGLTTTSPRGPLIHHATVVFLYVSAFLMIDVGAMLGGDERIEAVAKDNSVWPMIAWELLRMLFYFYIITFTSMQELIIDRCFQVLAWELKLILEDSQGQGVEVGDTCKRSRTCLDAQDALVSVSGGTMLVLVAFVATQIVFGSYYFCIVYLGIDWAEDLEPVGVQVLYAAGYGMFCLLNLKRLVRMANQAYEVSRRVDDLVEALIVAEGDAKTSTLEVKSTRRLLERAGLGGVSVMGFFPLGRATVLTILGQILTYIIIMLEFKNDVDILDGGAEQETSSRSSNGSETSPSNTVCCTTTTTTST